MSDLEILGKPKYRSRKRQDEEEASQTNPELSQKQIPNPDLEYERDAKDWWWCDDVWVSDCKKYQATQKNTDWTAQRQIGTDRSGSGTAD